MPSGHRELPGLTTRLRCHPTHLPPKRNQNRHSAGSEAASQNPPRCLCQNRGSNPARTAESILRKPTRPFVRLLACLLLAILVPASATPPQQTATRPFDADASRASFHVRTLWLSAIQGYFDHVSGFLRLYPNSQAEVFAWVDMRRLHTGSERYAEILRSEDFFAIARYPDMRFRSIRFDRDLLQQGGTIAGWLTLRDATRYIRLELESSNCPDVRAGACVLHLVGTIDRSDFGIRSYGLVVSQNVRLKLHVVLAAPGRQP